MYVFDCEDQPFPHSRAPVPARRRPRGRARDRLGEAETAPHRRHGRDEDGRRSEPLRADDRPWHHLGQPFDDGKIKLTVNIDLATSSATGTFRIRDAKGTAFGTFDMAMTLDLLGNQVDFDGTADITGGKGAAWVSAGAGVAGAVAAAF